MKDTVESSDRLKVESSVNVDPLRNAEVQLGWTALLEGFRNFWFKAGASYQEIRTFTGVEPGLFIKVGWLKKTTEQFNQCFFPDGALALQLARDAEPPQPETCNLAPASDIHVRTFPFPHVVPTTPERSTASEDQSGSLRDEAGAACAEAASEFNDAATGTPSTAVRRGGRWDANPVGPEWRVENGKAEIPSDLTRELAEVIGVLKVSADAVRERLTEITIEQQDAGWPERTQVCNAVAHLRRLASDLFNELADFELKSKLNLQLRKGGVR